MENVFATITHTSFIHANVNSMRKARKLGAWRLLRLAREGNVYAQRTARQRVLAGRLNGNVAYVFGGVYVPRT